jgi:outer membrane protein assembly factor BamB
MLRVHWVRIYSAWRGRFGPLALAVAGAALLWCHAAPAQPGALIWSGFARNAQHTALSSIAAQHLTRIRWQTPVDLFPQYSGDELLIHYGSPLVTRRNTVIVPVKTGVADGFRVEARNGTDGSLLWMFDSDYTLPPHNWVPSFSPVLTRARLWLAGGGGTLYWRSRPDFASRARLRQIVFYGRANFAADRTAYLSNVFINTPLTADRHGNIFFGFQVTGATPLNLEGGVARVASGGRGRRVAAATASGDIGVTKMPHNSAPALSNDEKTLYAVVSSGGPGYLLALDSRTLATIASVRLTDPVSGQDATILDDGTASPMVGPDGDVYFGILESPFPSHHDRGWMLHFSGALQPKGAPGSFGWDDTASVVPAAMVPSYSGMSSYLLMTKYNDYAEAGGDGVNRIAVLDPNDTMVDPISGATVMREVLTVAGPTPDDEFRPGLPDAVREWCINTAAIDPITKAIFAGSEDGTLYRWDMTTGTLSESIVLTPGLGEAYTPTVIGADGTVYAINNATLFAVGN